MASPDAICATFHGSRHGGPRQRSHGIRRGGVAALLVAAVVLASFAVFATPAAATHVPTWTYLKKDFGTRSDPVSLIVSASLSVVSASLLGVGWHKTTCGFTEYIYYNGQWVAQNLMLEKDQQGWCGIFGTRKHARLWQLEVSLVIIAVHVDHTHSNGHQVHDFEGVEGVMANDFRAAKDRSWQVAEDAHLMGNTVSYYHGSLLVFNDGNATEVSLAATSSLVVASGQDGAWASVSRIARTVEFYRT